jgi:hypothetical protein
LIENKDTFHFSLQVYCETFGNCKWIIENFFFTDIWNLLDLGENWGCGMERYWGKGAIFGWDGSPVNGPDPFRVFTVGFQLLTAKKQ